jgi:peptidoglycan/xylan/chitin deacetylase (PgdA/CDA1 family)
VLGTLLAPLLALATARTAPLSVTYVSGAGNAFALTFDGDEEAHGTAQLLALLRARHIHATLFVTGRFAELHHELLRRALADGHEIGNHTYSHPHLTTWAQNHRHLTLPGVTRAMLQDQLLAAARAIQRATGQPPLHLWRAPYGEHNAAIDRWAAELGYLQVGWTHGCGDALDALDWVEDPASRRFLGAEAMARHLLSFPRRCNVPLGGSIILMHLGSARSDLPLLEALPIVLDETDRLGLHAVPVTELLRRGGLPSSLVVDR